VAAFPSLLSTGFQFRDLLPECCQAACLVYEGLHGIAIEAATAAASVGDYWYRGG
jgi:hypothetical protein